jgi:hypothetical protein
MKIESTAFTAADLEQAGDQLIDHERQVLVDRLERASARLAELGLRVGQEQPSGQGGRPGPGLGEHGRQGGRPPSDDAWNATEVLAHIAVLSKFYGMLTYKVGTGQMTELDLLGNVNVRDVLGEQLAKESPLTLVEMAVADHRRTVEYLRSADAAAMRRECVVDGGRTVMRAEDMARQALIGHLEMHVDQLERALAG